MRISASSSSSATEQGISTFLQNASAVWNARKRMMNNRDVRLLKVYVGFAARDEYGIGVCVTTFGIQKVIF